MKSFSETPESDPSNYHHLRQPELAASITSVLLRRAGLKYFPADNKKARAETYPGNYRKLQRTRGQRDEQPRRFS